MRKVEVAGDFKKQPCGSVIVSVVAMSVASVTSYSANEGDRPL